MAVITALLIFTSGAALARKKPANAVVPPACTDFYEVSNHDWLQAHPLPVSAASVSVWDELNTLSDAQTRDLLARDTTTTAGPATQLLADLVASSHDSTHLLSSFRTTAKPLLAKIDAVKQARDVGKTIVTLQAAGIAAQPDSLGLPGREFYGRSEPALKALTKQYRQALIALLTATGMPLAKATTQADAALLVEKSLATAADADAVNKLLAKPNIAQWQAYLRTRVMLSLADALPDDPRRAYLTTLGRMPAATQQERVTDLIRNEGANLLDLAYAETFIGGVRLQKAQYLAEEVRAAMARALDHAAWLSPNGKATALLKLTTLKIVIGNSGADKPLSGLSFEHNDFAGNLLALRRWNNARLQTPNASLPARQTRALIGYQASENQVVVTAAALQSPIFSGDSAAADFGALGALIGQQISIAFIEFDGSDGSEFAKRQAGLIAQYSAYPATASVNVDGRRTQRMNAADLAGLELAWDAYRSRVSNEASNDQNFFRAWAAVWARQDQPATLAAAAETSVFAPSRWRVNGPMANLPAFAQTFSCPAGSPLARSNRDQTAIWR